MFLSLGHILAALSRTEEYHFRGSLPWSVANDMIRQMSLFSQSDPLKRRRARFVLAAIVVATLPIYLSGFIAAQWRLNKSPTATPTLSSSPTITQSQTVQATETSTATSSSTLLPTSTQTVTASLTATLIASDTSTATITASETTVPSATLENSPMPSETLTVEVTTTEPPP